MSAYTYKNYAAMFGGVLDLPADTTIGGAATVSSLGTVTSVSANAITVGRQGTTNPAFNVDASASSSLTGLNVAAAATGSGVTLSSLGGTDETIFITPKGAGLTTIQDPMSTHLTAAINSTATATAAQVKTGYITSTSAAAVTITLPTGTLLGAALGAAQGTVFDLFVDNTAGANTVTMAVAVNGIKSDAANTTAASFGQLTVASGATGLACFRLMFSSGTAYAFTRIA